MNRSDALDGLSLSPERVLDLVGRAEARKKLAWTAWRVLKEAALTKRFEKLSYKERKFVLKRITSILEELASQGVFQRRPTLQSIGYGTEVGFDFVRKRT
jgi:hypothetical protein